MSGVVRRTYAVTLSIPDNEAFTAAETLRRMGLPVAAARRAAIYTLAVDADAADDVEAYLRTLESVYNPNTHVLEARPDARPRRGEVWIAPLGDAPETTLGGRAIPGVTKVERRIAWELLDAQGNTVDSTVLDRAVETFLCNPAFQKAIR